MNDNRSYTEQVGMFRKLCMDAFPAAKPTQMEIYYTICCYWLDSPKKSAHNDNVHVSWSLCKNLIDFI